LCLTRLRWRPSATDAASGLFMFVDAGAGRKSSLRRNLGHSAR
jgi:hypothetical protein